MRYARIEPQVFQVELHPYLTQEGIVELAKTLGIAVTAYSSFGPQSYVELQSDKGTPSLFEHNVITGIAKAHNKSGLPQVFCLYLLTRWYLCVSYCTSDASMGDSAWYRCYSQE